MKSFIFYYCPDDLVASDIYRLVDELHEAVGPANNELLFLRQFRGQKIIKITSTRYDQITEKKFDLHNKWLERHKRLLPVEINDPADNWVFKDEV